jgi:hypothetical protein
MFWIFLFFMIKKQITISQETHNLIRESNYYFDTSYQDNWTQTGFRFSWPIRCHKMHVHDRTQTFQKSGWDFLPQTLVQVWPEKNPHSLTKHLGSGSVSLSCACEGFLHEEISKPRLDFLLLFTLSALIDRSWNLHAYVEYPIIKLQIFDDVGRVYFLSENSFLASKTLLKMARRMAQCVIAGTWSKPHQSALQWPNLFSEWSETPSDTQ